MSKLQQTAKGLPELPINSDSCDQCPICLQEKLHKAAHNKTKESDVTVCNQGISIDFGFVVQKSKNQERFNRFVGLNGETCYCIITNHKSGTVYGGTF